MNEETLKFICWLTGHDQETVKQMYNDYSSSPQAKSIPMQLPVGLPSETLSCELNGIKKGLGAIDSEARRQRRLAETFKVNDDSWKFPYNKSTLL